MSIVQLYGNAQDAVLFALQESNNYMVSFINVSVSTKAIEDTMRVIMHNRTNVPFIYRITPNLKIISSIDISDVPTYMQAIEAACPTHTIVLPFESKDFLQNVIPYGPRLVFFYK
jgi:hypothetical protein